MTESSGPEKLKKVRGSRWDVRPTATDGLAFKNQDSTESPPDKVAPTQKRVSRWDKEEQEENLEEISQSLKKKKLSIPTINGIPLSNEVLNIILLPDYEIIFDSKNQDNNTRNKKELVEEGYMIPLQSFKSDQILRDSIITSVPGMRSLEYFKEEDSKYFGRLLQKNESRNNRDNNDSVLTIDEKNELTVMKLLLNIKNGNPQVRKLALRQITDNARVYGAKVLFNQLLPLLMEPSLSDKERHNLVKVMDRILYKLNDLVQPFTEKIFKVITPLLTDENQIMRIEATEILANVIKASGLKHTIYTLRKNIDSPDDNVRSVTARTFAIAANTLGIQSLIPFIKAVGSSKKSWVIRHTASKIVQQIAIILGYSVLPHLKSLVGCIARSLNDDNLQVRKMTVVALSNLAEASAPYGIESFEENHVLEDLWEGIKRHRGSGLAAYLKCMGSLLPLMDKEYGNYYANELFPIILREFSSSDDDMKRTVLKVVQQCSIITAKDRKSYIQNEIFPALLSSFWNRRSALDLKLNKNIIDATVCLAKVIGHETIIDPICNFLKDENEFLRNMAVTACERILITQQRHAQIQTNNKLNEVSLLLTLTERTEERLIDGLLVVVQKDTSLSQEGSGRRSRTVKSFGAIINSLDYRIKPYIPQVVSVILYRLKNESMEVRRQSADLITAVIPAIKICNEFNIMSKLSKILYESLGEVYPEVLGSLLQALKTIISTNGVGSMDPSVDQMLPNLVPILKNRHEKVQENVIDLIGLIANNASEYIPPKEWMRICFELLDLLKSTRKTIRISANRTFGYIAKSIGPQEVLSTLLNNLRVQERQSRVCTAVAIAIVAETCQPFTIIPSIMNEYRTPEKNVQNGVLKAMTFMFEYIDGKMTRDYIYSVTKLLEDALIDRDQIHRQTAATVIKHMAINTVGLGLEDVFIHFLNLILPNIYETSPHVISRIFESLAAIRTNIGVGIFMKYILLGLWHPAKKVRIPYWRLYNDCYIQSEDSMVPYYPDFKDLHEEHQDTQEGSLSSAENFIPATIEELDVWI